MLVDVTGSVEFGAQVVLEAFAHGKHVVLMNAELDATIGPILNVYAKRAGVILSACDGDEPGLQMNLVRWVQGLGLMPRVIGNVKGLQDPVPQPGDAARLRREVGPEPGDGDLVRRRLEDQLRADDRRQRDRLQGPRARHVARRQVRRLAAGAAVALRHRRDARARRHHRLHGRAVVGEGLRASPSTPTPSSALPEPVQAGRGPAVPVLDPVPPAALRGAERDRARRAVRRPCRAAARRPRRRGLRGGQARPEGRRGARRLRHVHDLRRGGERRGDVRAAPAARGPGRGLHRCFATWPRTRS